MLPYQTFDRLTMQYLDLFIFIHFYCVVTFYFAIKETIILILYLNLKSNPTINQSSLSYN